MFPCCKVRLILLASCLILGVSSHGRLSLPPARSTAWRFGFDTPANYNDNELFCGGYANQWERNDGKCGICGDPYDGVREHEAGGKYATGTIVAEYEQGQVIDVTVDITANHLGYIEFRLCPHNNIHVAATQDCFDRHVVELADESGTRMPIDATMFLTKLKLRLPADVTCEQCILQWKYNCGNRWGTDPETGENGLGLGPQEQFYGCADIRIHGHGSATSTKPSTTTPRPVKTTPKPTPTTTQPSPTTTKPLPTTTTPSVPTSHPYKCWAVNDYEGIAHMDKWCNDNCMSNFCPPEVCKCE